MTTEQAGGGARLLFVLGVLLHIAFALSLPSGFLNPLFVEAVEGFGQASDFYGIYQAGANLLGGYSIYDREEYRNEAPPVVPFSYYYRYLPPTAYGAALGAALLPPQAAYWVWVGLVELILLATVVSLLRWRVFPVRRRWILAGLWLGFFPYCIEQIMGQYSLCMAALLWFLWRHDANAAGSGRRAAAAPREPVLPRPPGASRSALWADRLLGWPGWRPSWQGYRWSGDRLAARASWWAWTASLSLKTFSALLAVAYLRDARIKRVLAGGMFAAGISAPYFLFRPEDLLEFIRLNFAPFTPRVYKGALGLQTVLQDLAAQYPQGLGTVLFTVGDRCATPGHLLMIATSGAVLLAAVWATLQAGGQSHRRAFDMAIWTTAFFLIFKSVWEYHYVMMLPAVSAVYLVTGGRWALCLGIALGLPTLYPLAPLLAGVSSQAALESWPGWFRTLHFSVKALPTLAFFVGCIVTVRLRRQHPAAAAPSG